MKAERLIPGPIYVAIQRVVKGFLFVPAMFALAGLLLPIPALWVDRSEVLEEFFTAIVFFDIEIAGARTVLSTIAGAMMTVISLAYSLTLIVFTLAAANIGPRLLENFTKNRINQITVGMLSATYLYSLLLLYLVQAEHVPRFSVALAILLATVSLFILIYFVSITARSVRVDSEVARTQRALRDVIDGYLKVEPHDVVERDDVVPRGAARRVKAPRSGYVTGVDIGALVKLAEEFDGFVEMTVCPGDFVVGDMTLLMAHGMPKAGAKELAGAIYIGDSRAPEGDMLFSVHLNVEIALRALSPGINDTYTAIAAMDHLSASLALILQRGAPPAVHRDEAGAARVWMAYFAMDDVVDMAIDPVRFAASDNPMMLISLARAIARMASVADPSHTPLLMRHLRQLAAAAREGSKQRIDRAKIAAALAEARTKVREGRTDAGKVGAA